VIARRLGRALDWRFGALAARLDTALGQIRQLEGQLDVVAGQLRELASASGRSAEDAAAVRTTVEQSLQPVLRAILDEESENRRRLYAARDTEAYEAAYSDPSPLVSITVATRDRPDLLVARALPSLLAQTYGDLEVLVVGDAASPQVAEAVAGLRDARVHYANLTQRVMAHPDASRHWLVGSTMARNEGARRARGRWLLHFDDDDHLRPDAIACLLELAREQRAEVAYGGFEEHQPGGGTSRSLAFPPRSGAFGWQGALVHSELRLFERELVAAHLGIPGDAYLLERMLRAGVRFAMLDAVVWDYFPSTLWRPSSVSTVSSQTSSTIPGSSSE
jgi:Glycosyl transferase family 2